MNEFEIISRYFKQPFKQKKVFSLQRSPLEPKIKLAIGDDCASFTSSKKYEIVISTDQLIESVHFFPNLDPKSIAKKALTRSLSDLAAMGAKPLGFTLNLATPYTSKKWFASFSKGLLATAKQYCIPLIGGDLSANRQIIVSIQVFGYVLKNKLLKRSNLRAGDYLCVTGDIGGSGLALMRIKSHQTISKSLKKRLNEPAIPIKFAQKISKKINCGIDVSDGLFQDMMHLAKQSDCGLKLDLKAVEKKVLHCKVQKVIQQNPFSSKSSKSSKKRKQQRIKKIIHFANQGDDYELLLACKKSQLGELKKIAKKNGTQIHTIGRAQKDKKIMIFYGDFKQKISPNSHYLKGFNHF